MKKTTVVIILIVGLAALWFGVRFFMGGNEDTWLCVNGQWVKHGNPSASAPTTGCGVQPAQPAKATSTEPPAPTAQNSPIYTVGYVMRHRLNLLNQPIRTKGYVIQRQVSYIIFSDEPVAVPNPNDLPVTGQGIAVMASGKQYILAGKLVYKGLAASNQNPYHFELATPPEMVQPN